MILPAILVLGQWADGLAFILVAHLPGEANPLMASIPPTTVLALKAAAAIVLGFGSWVLARRHRALVAWMACVGWVGALTEVWAAG